MRVSYLQGASFLLAERVREGGRREMEKEGERKPSGVGVGGLSHSYTGKSVQFWDLVLASTCVPT